MELGLESLLIRCQVKQEIHLTITHRSNPAQIENHKCVHNFDFNIITQFLYEN